MLSGVLDCLKEYSGIMNSVLCVNCFRIKGDYEICPFCGYIQGDSPKELFQLKPGTILQDRYIIGEAIGFGGFGITYKAYDTVLGIIVAIKEFYPSGLVNRAEGEKKIGVFSGSKTQEFEKLFNRFLDEARNMALFEKESDFVKVYAYFRANNTAYIIMDYIENPSLKQYLNGHGKIEVQQACDYICAILTAIQKIHDKGIIHGDVSPDNIFVISDKQIKLFDFGAAKLQNENIMQKRTVVVKAGYAPLEQYRSKGLQDYRIDIYAAGAILYHMITGERPVEALERSQKDTLLSPSERGIKLPSYIEKAMMKALAMNPKERFSSAEEFKKALMKGQKKKWWGRNI